MPKIDAMSGSITGTHSANSEATGCDIFPNVSSDIYKANVVDIFKRLAEEIAGKGPLNPINDGKVTVLAAMSKVKARNTMGISMGSRKEKALKQPTPWAALTIWRSCRCQTSAGPRTGRSL